MMVTTIDFYFIVPILQMRKLRHTEINILETIPLGSDGVGIGTQVYRTPQPLLLTNNLSWHQLPFTQAQELRE